MIAMRATLPATLLIILLMGCASTVQSGQGAETATTEINSHHLRLIVSTNAEVYFQFQGTGMRVSASAEELASAPVVKALAATPAGKMGQWFAQFPEVELPVPANALPPCTEKMTARFRYVLTPVSQRRMIVGGLKFLWNDEAGHEWACLQGINEEIGGSPANAPAVRAVDPADMRLDGVTRVSSGEVALAVRLMAKDEELSGIHRDGTSVDLKVCLRDPHGNDLAAAEGPLSRFGFG
jgi:hypothetical protein